MYVRANALLFVSVFAFCFVLFLFFYFYFFIFLFHFNILLCFVAHCFRADRTARAIMSRVPSVRCA